MPDPKCLFCKIAAGDLGTEFVHQDEHVVAFHDVSPQAPTHVLVIPRKHVAAVSDLNDEPLAGKVLLATKTVAAALGLEAYRLVINCGAEAGQSVFHLHVHILAGRPLTWPPG
jgi:histidine triad (HIT) family protein